MKISEGTHWNCKLRYLRVLSGTVSEDIWRVLGETVGEGI